jgi:hypothetical protein
MDKKEMIDRIRNATPEMRDILGDDKKPTEEPYMNQRTVLELNKMILDFSEHHESFTKKNELQIVMALQMMYWSVQKNKGVHEPEPKEGAPVVTKEQVHQMHQYLTTA